MVTHSSTYPSRFLTCGADIYNEVITWTNKEWNLTNPPKLDYMIGDLFEYMELWLIGHGLSQVLLSCVIDSYEHQTGQWYKDCVIAPSNFLEDLKRTSTPSLKIWRINAE